MTRDRKDLGARKFVRVELRKRGFLIPAPDAAWIECYIHDISDNGACLDVGDLAVPRVFGLSLTAGGEVRRVCTLIWRKRGGSRYSRSAFFNSRSIRSWTRRMASRLSLASVLPAMTLSPMRNCHFQMPGATAVTVNSTPL